MFSKKFLALSGAVLASLLALAPAAGASHDPAPVTIRIEGKTKTLLASTDVKTHPGSITVGGAPKGACPAKSAQGALDVATDHKWSGKWYGKYDEYEIFTILGDHESGTKYFWEIFVNNVAATAGACEIKLKPGDRLLFAAVSVKGIAYPTALIAPSHAVANQPFKVKVVYYNAKGKAKPLAGAVVSVKGHSAKTGSNGTITLTGDSAGTYSISESKSGYVRAVPVTVHVTS
jgi:Domain of unknown function (DUF4430)